MVDTSQPIPLQLLEQYGISKSGIARQLGYSPNKIGIALNPDRFSEIKHSHLMRIRRRVETLVRVAGWEGTSDALWKDYKEHVQVAA